MQHLEAAEAAEVQSSMDLAARAALAQRVLLPPRWAKEGQLMAGGMSLVIKCTSTLPRRPTTRAAVKVMELDSDGDEDSAAREVRAMRRLAGAPFVAPLLFAERQELRCASSGGSSSSSSSNGSGEALLAFELPPAVMLVATPLYRGDLFGLSCGHELGLEPEIVLFVAAQMLTALAHLEARGVLHNDVKLENVCVTSSGNLRLIDLGAACTLDAGRDWDAAAGRAQVVTESGTLPYAAPEVLRRLRHGHESDLWSLGVMLFELLYGELPFPQKDDPLETCRDICEAPLVVPEGLRPGWPAQHLAEDLVRSLLVRRPSDRLGYAGVADVMAHEALAPLDWALLEAERYESPLKALLPQGE